MEHYRVEVAKAAKGDLCEINRYISVELKAPASALTLADAFADAFVDLENMPQKYPLVRDEQLAAMGYRRLGVKNYSVFYKINETTHEVDIARILHGRRDWQNIL